MRSKLPYLVLRYNDEGGINFLTVNGQWSTLPSPGDKANQNRYWHNSGNAWRAISKLVKDKKQNFDNLFVWCQNGLANFTRDDAISVVRLLSNSTDQGKLNVMVDVLLKSKSNQINLLQEILSELQVISHHPNSEDN